MATVLLSSLQNPERRTTATATRSKGIRANFASCPFSPQQISEMRDSCNFLRVTSSTHSGLGNLAPSRIRPPGLLFAHTTTAAAVFFLLPFYEHAKQCESTSRFCPSFLLRKGSKKHLGNIKALEHGLLRPLSSELRSEVTSEVTGSLRGHF